MIVIAEKKDNKANPRKSGLIDLVVTFIKAQLSAFISVLFDYAVMISLTEWAGVYYLYSIPCGAVVGSIVNYLINRYWAFKARSEPVKTQLPKFALVVVGSIILKTGGTYLLTEYIHIDYKISRIIADGIVAYGFIFVLQKTWVFKK